MVSFFGNSVIMVEGLVALVLSLVLNSGRVVWDTDAIVLLSVEDVTTVGWDVTVVKFVSRVELSAVAASESVEDLVTSGTVLPERLVVSVVSLLGTSDMVE